MFRVSLRNDAVSGSAVENKASIVFDVNPPLETNLVQMTMDKSAPSSQVETLALVQAVNSFEVKWSGQDEEGGSGVASYDVWVSVDGGEWREWLKETEATSAVFEGEAGHTYAFYTIARDRLGNLEVPPEQADTRLRVGVEVQEVRAELPSGLLMLSIPVVPTQSDPQPLIGFTDNRWARWDPSAGTTGSYTLYPDPYTFFDTETIGKSYWVMLDNRKAVFVAGTPADQQSSVSIALKKGWNQMGNPFLTELVWDVGAIQVQVSRQRKALKEAYGIVESYAWRWDGSDYRLVYDASVLPGVDNKLSAWEGAWIYAHQDGTLILPAPSGRATWANRSRRQKPEGWLARLTVQVGHQTAEGIMGVTTGRRLRLSEPPPPFGGEKR